jgi:hypothetical protein
MISGSYVLNSHDSLLRDINEPLSHTEIDALIASGDLFVTLATDVDGLTECLPLGNANKAYQKLEKLTSILLYLQRHYSLVRKHSDYRQ